MRYRFKYSLPKMTMAELDGIKLDLSPLSLKARNRILMGIYEMHEKQMCQEFLHRSDAVVEIGGAIGYLGLVCQKKVGISKYATFEANPVTVEILRRNYELNGLEAQVWNLALGPEEGCVQLEVANDFWENKIASAPNGGSSSQTVKVAAAPLRTLLRHVEFPVNALIVDVEGAEQYIDPQEIPETVEKIIIELHPAIIGQEKTYSFIAALIHAGFAVAREESSSFTFLKQRK